MEADNFLFLSFDTALRVARAQGLLEILPSLDTDKAIQIRLTERGRQVQLRLQDQLPRF